MKTPVVISENQFVIIVDKPAGLIVHSDGRTNEPTLAVWLVEKYPYLRDVGGYWISPQGERIALAGLAHRLDRSTSGVLVVAKTQEVFEYLKQEFKERRVEKLYRAYVYGTLPQNGRVVAEIMRSTEFPRKWYARTCDESDKRAAITEWKLLKTNALASSIELVPKTGRTHQIRVHMASIGNPIVADHVYAPDREPVLGFTRPALHAYSISLTMPDRTTCLSTAPLPEDFQNAEI